MKNSKVVEWIKVLRETDEAQCLGTLFDGKGYCCMGLADKFVFGNEFTYDKESHYAGYEDSNHNSGMLSMNDNILLGIDRRVTEEEFQAIRGLTHIFPGAERQYVLAALNDKSGLSFREIADFIEEMRWDDEL